LESEDSDSELLPNHAETPDNVHADGPVSRKTVLGGFGRYAEKIAYFTPLQKLAVNQFGQVYSETSEKSPE